MSKTLQAEIKEKSNALKLLLEAMSHEDALIVAVRASLRSLPVIWNWAAFSKQAADWKISPLAPLWANLSAWLVVMRPSEFNKTLAEVASDFAQSIASETEQRMADNEDFGGAMAVTAAVFAASHAAHVKFPTVNQAAFYAALYASTCGGAGSRELNARFFDAALRDCALLGQGKDPNGMALWHAGPNPVAKEWAAFNAKPTGALSRLTRLFKGGADQPQNIWIDWYQRVLDGRDQPHLNQLEQTSAEVRKRLLGAQAA